MKIGNETKKEISDNETKELGMTMKLKNWEVAMEKNGEVAMKLKSYKWQRNLKVKISNKI